MRTLPIVPAGLQNMIGLAYAPAPGQPAAGADKLWGLVHSLYQYVRQLRLLVRLVVAPGQLPDLPDWPDAPVDWVSPP